jgi:hypothetical protein
MDEPCDVDDRLEERRDVSRRISIDTCAGWHSQPRYGGRAQMPPLIDMSSFHRFGVRLNTKAEPFATGGFRARRRSGSSMRPCP